VIGEAVVGRDLALLMKCECPIDELFARPDERPVVIDGVRMVGGEHQLAVQPVHTAAIADQAIENCLAVDEILNRFTLVHARSSW